MHPREVTRVGKTAVEVTRLGLGTAALGGWPRGVSFEQGQATVRRAWESGIRYFDTAPYYGYGKSEQFLGGVLQSQDRSSFTLSTKVGRVLEPGREPDPFYRDALPFTPVYDFSRAAVARSLAESRQRLGFTRVDIVYIHDPDDHLDAAVQYAHPVLAELREAGQIGAIGVGITHHEPLLELVQRADFDCALLAGRYTLLEQEPLDELFPLFAERGMSIVAGGVYNSGLLVAPKRGATYDYAPASDDLVRRSQLLEGVCREFGIPLRAAALQFAAAHPVVATVVMGACTPEEVEDNLAMARLEIPGGLWVRLKERGLIRSDAPTP